MYGTTRLKVPTVVEQHTGHDAASSAPTIVGEPMESLDSVHGKSHMLQVTSRP